MSAKTVITANYARWWPLPDRKELDDDGRRLWVVYGTRWSKRLEALTMDALAEAWGVSVDDPRVKGTFDRYMVDAPHTSFEFCVDEELGTEGVVTAHLNSGGYPVGHYVIVEG